MITSSMGSNRSVMQSPNNPCATDVDFLLQANGCILVKTKQAVLVAEYVAPNQAPEVSVVVEGVADYLIGLNY
jgi:hypothetical protein